MTLAEDVFVRLDRALSDADARAALFQAGDHGVRQPVHTVSVPADQFDVGTAMSWGDQAMGASYVLLGGSEFADSKLAEQVVPRVRAKLSREPIEDLRVDFADGYGVRPDEEEDAAAVAAGHAIAGLVGRPATPPFVGVRVKPLDPATRHRAVHTLDLLLGAAVPNGLPAGFVITLPRVSSPDQVAAFADVCSALEHAHALPSGRLRFGIQIGSTQPVLDLDGTSAVTRMILAGQGRVAGLHYDTYSYSAAVGVVSPLHGLDHPAADHAKSVLQLAAAATGVWLSDGACNVLPSGDADQLRAVGRLHARLVRRALERGFYQGWDLHPGQLVTRYAATYGFYRQHLAAASDRLHAYLAGQSSGIVEQTATAASLAGLLVRGLHCGALDADEIEARTGATIADLDALQRRRTG